MSATFTPCKKIKPYWEDQFEEVRNAGHLDYWWVRKNNLWFLYNRNTITHTPEKPYFLSKKGYEGMYPVAKRPSIWFVSTNGKWGVLDVAYPKEPLLPIKYDEIIQLDNFSGGPCIIWENNKCGIYNVFTNTFTVPIENDQIIWNHPDFMWLQKKGKWSPYNTKTKANPDTNYDEVECGLGATLWMFKKDGKWGIYNTWHFREENNGFDEINLMDNDRTFSGVKDGVKGIITVKL